MRFHLFAAQSEQLKKFDYVFFFNANMLFVNPVDLAEITPREWHDGLVARIHPGRVGDIYANAPDKFPYERRPQSTAYIPYGTGKYYVCGAFNGGTSDAFLKMCRKLKENVDIDLKNGIVADVDDESHLNAYMLNKRFLLCGRAYGFPEGKLKSVNNVEMPMIKIISRSKDSPKYGGTKWLRGQSDRKIPNNWFTKNVMRTICRAVALVAPSSKLRGKLRRMYG